MNRHIVLAGTARAMDDLRGGPRETRNALSVASLDPPLSRLSALVLPLTIPISADGGPDSMPLCPFMPLRPRFLPAAHALIQLQQITIVR